MRVPGWLYDEFARRAEELERYLDTATLAQSEAVYLPGGRNETFGVAKWQIAARALRSQEREEARRQRTRERSRRRLSKSSDSDESEGSEQHAGSVSKTDTSNHNR